MPPASGLAEENNRFIYFAYFRNLLLSDEAQTLVWYLNPDIAYAPNIFRQSAAPGLALIGDAALAPDPVWGNGMGWAFNPARWLVDKTAKALRLGTAEDINRWTRLWGQLPRAVIQSKLTN